MAAAGHLGGGKGWLAAGRRLPPVLSRGYRALLTPPGSSPRLGLVERHPQRVSNELCGCRIAHEFGFGVVVGGWVEGGSALCRLAAP